MEKSSILKVGFIGLGTISHENVLGYLDSTEAQIVSVCRREEVPAREWLRKYHLDGVRWYADYRQMLEKEELDVVEILTPHFLHHEQSMACANAGVRGISLQKPMAITLNQCDEIIETCKNNSVILKVYDNFVFYPVYQKAKELINEGLIGNLMSIRVNTISGMREGAPWPWCWTPGSWSLDLERSGVGPMVGDDGFHKFSLTRWFMERDYEKVSAWIDPETPLDSPAYIRAKFRRLPGDIPKYAQVDFSFSTKLAIPCDFWLDDFIEIIGEKGVMWIHQCSAAGDREFFLGAGDRMSASPLFPPIVVFVNGEVRSYLSDMPLKDRNWSSSFIRSTQHFIQVMKKGGTPVYTGEEGKEITRYAMAAFVSAQDGRDVYMDEITSESEAAGSFRIKTNFCNLSTMQAS